MTPLAKAVRAKLTQVADPARAPAMQAYMKSVMPYHGVSAVPLRQACKAMFAGLSWPDRDAWEADVLALWRGARFREERYAAIELCDHRAARAFRHVDSLPMYEEMIVSGAWWDYVDNIASRLLWPILDNDRQAMTAAMLGWSTDENLWKRRSAILCQLPAKRKTDLDLLHACIEPSLGSKEFFLRKAIGWALRQYARIDPDEVRRYVAAHEHRLNPLSKREALKHL